MMITDIHVQTIVLLNLPLDVHLQLKHNVDLIISFCRQICEAEMCIAWNKHGIKALKQFIITVRMQNCNMRHVQG